MPNPSEKIKLILFVLGLALLLLSVAAPWRYMPGCIIGWSLSWSMLHALHWFDEVFDPFDYCDPCSGVCID